MSKLTEEELLKIREEVAEGLEQTMKRIRSTDFSDPFVKDGNHYYSREGLYPTLSPNFLSTHESDKRDFESWYSRFGMRCGASYSECRKAYNLGLDPTKI